MVQYMSSERLPTAEELPETDHQPVDNELQIYIPTLLQAILSFAWADRTDWFFGINIGLYHVSKRDGVGPDALLRLGVERFKAGQLRLSYVVYEENNVVPQWALEIVSKTPGGEYGAKFKLYGNLGILYYAIYNPDYWRRDGHDPFELYRLENGIYVRQPGDPIWMPEVGLGIGRDWGTHHGYQREWLYWYDQQGQRYPAAADIIQQAQHQAEQERLRAEQERLRAEQAEQRSRQIEQQLEQERLLAQQERQRADRLTEWLRLQGIDPDNLS